MSLRFIQHRRKLLSVGFTSKEVIRRANVLATKVEAALLRDKFVVGSTSNWRDKATRVMYTATVVALDGRMLVTPTNISGRTSELSYAELLAGFDRV